MSLRDLRRHVGRLAIVGFTGYSVPAGLRELVRTFDLGGVVYFARNVDSPGQLADLSREVAALAHDWPLWIAVDQEGGRVARLKAPFTEWPPAITLGRSDDDALTARFARAMAAELSAAGINLNHAPVLDVLTRQDNPAIGDRALSQDAEVVARLGAVIIRELQAAGIAACGKHFPGHGDTMLDSHDDLPVVEHDRRRLEAVELVPFRRAIAADVAAIMTAHVLVPAIDPDRPASMSPGIVQRWLKDDLGFGGMVLSDDLGMGAVSKSRSLGAAAVDALSAGTDMVLLCNSTLEEQVVALEAVIRAAESGLLTGPRLDDAMSRQQRIKGRFLARGRVQGAAPVAIGGAAHQAVSRDMAAWL